MSATTFAEKLSILGALLPTGAYGHYTLSHVLGTFRLTIYLTADWSDRTDVVSLGESRWYETSDQSVEHLIEQAIRWLMLGPSPSEGELSDLEAEEHARIFQIGFDSVLPEDVRRNPHLRTPEQVRRAALAGEQAIRSRIASKAVI